MLSSLRILAWRVLEQGRRVLRERRLVICRPVQSLPQPSPSVGLTSRAPQQKPSLFQRYYLLQQQALKQSIPVGNRPRGRGGGGGPNSSDGAASRPVAPFSPPLPGLLGRLGPLVSGAVRRLASVRRPSSGGRRLLYRDTAPLFALVGVTLAGVGEDGEDDGGESVLKRRGFVTRQEELEAICCTIRDAVTRSDWLFDPDSWAPHTPYTSKLPSHTDDHNQHHNQHQHNQPTTTNGDEIHSNVSQEESGGETAAPDHVYSLQDLELDGVIDKGCNAVVYAARWKKEESPAVDETNTTTAADVTLHSTADDINSASSASTSCDDASSQCPTSAHVQNTNSQHSTSSHDQNISSRHSTSAQVQNPNSQHSMSAPIEDTSSQSSTSPQVESPSSEASITPAAAAAVSLASSDHDTLSHNTLVNSLSPQHVQSVLSNGNDYQNNFDLNDRLNLNDTFNDSITSLYNRSNNNNINNNINEGDRGSLSNVLDSNFLTNLNSSVPSFEQLSCSSTSAFSGNPGGLLTVLPFHGSTVSLSSQAIRRAAAEFGGEPSELYSTNTGHSNDLARRVSRSRRVSGSLAEDLLLSSGGFGLTPQRLRTNKRVRFQAPPPSDGRRPSVNTNNNNEASVGQDNRSNRSNASNNNNVNAAVEEGNSSTRPTGEMAEFPLAVKLVFNYEAASNAPAILSALYRELLPARALQLDATYDHWRRDFFGDSSHCRLPAHPNIVDMPCAFVDRVPLLEGGHQLYPLALPARLHPEGLGRNMSLFCVMQRYDMSLASYLQQHPSPSARTGTLLLAQLLEALAHLHGHNICHRDLKPDNILLSLRDGWQTPLLVLTDFGCCLAASSASGLSVPFMSREAEPRQGNVALMAPEVKCARPGLLQSIDFSRGDLWAAGTIAYQFFGLPNPFLSHGAGPPLDSGRYREGQLPGLQKTEAPPVVARLVGDLLRRRPQSRPSPSVAATLCQLALWGPSPWLNRHAFTKPKHDQVLEWLLSLTTKVLCDRRGGNSVPETEYRLVSTFLARLRYKDVLQAIAWNRAF